MAALGSTKYKRNGIRTFTTGWPIQGFLTISLNQLTPGQLPPDVGDPTTGDPKRIWDMKYKDSIL